MAKQVKTTRKDFERFKREFTRWQKRLGLELYRIDFRHTAIGDNFAQILVDEEGRVATVALTKGFDKGDEFGFHGAAAAGQHEALHLLLHRLYWLGRRRHIRDGELEEEWERIVLILQSVLQ